MPKHMAGKNTLFPHKILKCLEKDYSGEMHGFKMRTFFNYSKFKGWDTPEAKEVKPKLHTIREDKSDSWKAGRPIHFVINNRSKNRYQFAPEIPAVSEQKIEIKHIPGNAQINIDGNFYGEIFHHGLDDIYEWTEDLEQFAINDGFDSLEDFFAWFNEDFKGKIIHWTELKY